MKHLFTLILFTIFSNLIISQGSENFSNIPTASPTNYNTRSWTGTDGNIWGATLARTDQTINGKAICTNGSGTVTSPTYANGMGTLTFNYVRAFTGTGARSIQIWVNGSQYGPTITVSPTSDVVVNHSEPISVSGNVTLELRTSGAQIKIDDVAWNTFSSCFSPTTPPSAFSSSNISTTSMDIAWTNGNGDNTLVVARAGSAVNTDPMSGSTYTADASFGNGTQIGTGNFVVYNGSGSNVSITNLISSTTYHYAIYAFNNTGNCYNLTELTGNATTTGPEIQLQYPGTNNVACGFTLPFGNVNINSTADLSYNIKNDGTSNLEVSSLDIMGMDGSLYSIISSHSFPIIITPGNTEIVTVRFAPTTGGSKSATLTIENNDSNEDPCTVILSGSGIVPPAYYRTKQSGLWSAASTWETSTDNVMWMNASGVPTVNDFDISIRSPHNVSISTSISMDQTIVEVGSVLEVTANVTLEDGTGDDLQVFGTLRSSASITTTGNIIVKNEGVYQHNVATGTTRIPLSTWETGSTCEVIGYTTGGALTNAGFNQNFYNFIWNCTSQTIEQNLNGTLTSIAGDFTVQNTGSSSLRLIGSTSTLIIEGNLTVNSGGILNMSGTSQICNIEVTGNVIINGTLTELGTGSGMIIFVGNTQSLTVNGIINNNVNFTVDNGSTIDILTDVTMPNNLTLTNGLIRVNNDNLTVNGNIIGGSSVSYIQTNGLGLLKQNVSTTKLFPVGNTTYNPTNLTIANVTEIGVRVLDGVYASGLTGSAITEKVVNRTWDINATITNPLTLEVFWLSTNESVDFDRSSCYISHFINGAWEGDTPSVALGSGPFSLSRVVTSLSPFAVGSLGALPVEFISFNALKKNSKSILNFSTASETNNDYFTIERSKDGRNYDAIGEIKGAGNSNAEITYEFTDEKPHAGINYYRIKQTDYDGKYSYSDIKSVRHTSLGNLSITPRTTEGRLQVTTDMEDYTIDVYNVAGQQVKSFRSLSFDQLISIDDLTAGLYYVKVNFDGQVEIIKVVKI